MCGISSGTNVAAALSLARKLGPGKTVVTVLPDTAERYFSTPLFEACASRKARGKESGVFPNSANAMPCFAAFERSEIFQYLPAKFLRLYA